MAHNALRSTTKPQPDFLKQCWGSIKRGKTASHGPCLSPKEEKTREYFKMKINNIFKIKPTMHPYIACLSKGLKF